MSDPAPLPFATATIARLYMAQGKLSQAEALYRQLLKANPEDSRLNDGLAEVQRRRQTGGLPLGADRLELKESGAKLRCTWNITEEALQRARELLQAPGQVILRLIAFPQGPDQVPVDTAMEGLQGTLELPHPGQAALIAAAVGLQGEDRFISIAHCTFNPRG